VIAEGDVATFRLKYVVEDVDRHGNVRAYFRRKDHPKVRLHGVPGSVEFMEAYSAALEGSEAKAEDSAKKPAEGAPGSLRAVCVAYYGHGSFRRLDARTQRIRRGILDGLCRKHGTKPLNLMRAKHVEDLRDGRAEHPEAANAIVKALRQLFKFAIGRRLAETNPARDVEYLRSGGEGFHAWTLEEVEQYEAVHPVGTRARLALALLLYTAQRRSDVVLFGRQHIRAGKLQFTQQKNRRKSPVTLSIPVVPELQGIIDASPCGDLTFLVTEFGKGFTANGFGNRMRKWCDEAGLPLCSAHGLRKAAAARLAELGCSEEEIKAVTGHRTSKEVSRYTRGARQSVLAESAMGKLAASHSKGGGVSHRQKTG
jgi:integrase